MKISDFTFDGSGKFELSKHPHKIPDFYADTEEYEAMIADTRKEMDALQSMMYAHNRYGLLVIFQAMDAAGKDSCIKHAMSGVNPHGVQVHTFKRPTETELEHDYMWRTTMQLPERGRLTIFNRSYYEEVLVVRVHPEILTNVQRIPAEQTTDLGKVWKERYADMVNFENYLHRNGIRVVKIFLNVSKHEQAKRFLERINEPAKNWKFAEADLKERGFWDEYMQAYQDAINHTASAKCPWYIVPADDKKNARLISSQIIIEAMKDLKMEYPRLSAEQLAGLERSKAQLMKEMKDKT